MEGVTISDIYLGKVKVAHPDGPDGYSVVTQAGRDWLVKRGDAMTFVEGLTDETGADLGTYKAHFFQDHGINIRLHGHRYAHIFADGTLCIGENAPVCYELVRVGLLAEALAIMLDVFTHPVHGPYYRVKSHLIECDTCGEKFDRRTMKRCWICRNRVCSEHQLECKYGLIFGCGACLATASEAAMIKRIKRTCIGCIYNGRGAILSECQSDMLKKMKEVANVKKKVARNARRRKRYAERKEAERAPRAVEMAQHSTEPPDELPF